MTTLDNKQCAKHHGKREWVFKQNSNRHKRVEKWAKSINDFGNFGRLFPAQHPQKSSQHVRACAVGDGAICSKNRKIVPYHGTNPNTRNGARLRSLSPIMAPGFTGNKTFFHASRENPCTNIYERRLEAAPDIDIILANYYFFFWGGGGSFLFFYSSGIMNWKPNYTFLMALLTQLDT